MRGLGRKESKAGALRVVIVGGGEVGFHIAKRLAEENKQVVLIDRNAEALRRASEHLDVQVVQGSGSSPAILDQADLESADILLAVTDSDETNIIACIFAGALAPQAVKVARIRNEEYLLYKDVLPKEILDVGMVINPEVEVIKSIDRLVTVPGAVDYSEFADGRIRIIGVRAERGALVNAPLAVARDKMPPGTLIAAIVRGDRLIIPTGQDAIQHGDLVYFVCEENTQTAMLRAFGCVVEPVKKVMIIGGGTIGMRLASLFEQRNYHIRVMDKNGDRCNFLAEKLNRAIVLCGDATDQDFLREENVGEMDAVFSLTHDDETNILTALLAKRLGARKAIPRVNKFSYLPLVQAVGIEHSVSPRLSAINSILRFVRKGRVISSVSLKGEEAEVMEAIAQERSPIVGRPLKTLHFPKGAILLSILRGKDVVIPAGGTVIQPQDRILIFATRQAVPQVEQALTVKLESI